MKLANNRMHLTANSSVVLGGLFPALHVLLLKSVVFSMFTSGDASVLRTIIIDWIARNCVYLEAGNKI